MMRNIKEKIEMNKYEVKDGARRRQWLGFIPC
jgi:hypothetical protein